MKKRLLQVGISLVVILGGWFTYQYLSWNTLPPTNEFPVTREHTSGEYFAEIETASRYLKTIPDSLHVPSISVAVGIKGEVVWSEAIGFADLENKIPATPKTAYRIGSSSKAVTATAIMLLADEAQIDIDSPVNDLIPQLPSSFPGITTRQLLSHTAGYGNYEDFPMRSWYYFFCNCKQFNSVDEALPLFIDSPLLYSPGEDFEYSSFDVIVASKMIEVVTGQPFLTFLKEKLFEPLNMTHSFGDHGPYQVEPKAAFYGTKNNSYRRWHTFDIFTYETNLSYKWAGGGLLSTPTDMVRMGNALVADSTFISFKTRDNFFSPQKLNNGEVNEQRYAVGWRSYHEYASNDLLGEDVKVWMVHHGGVSKGSLNLIALFPEYQLVIDAAINGRQQDLNFTPFWNEVMRLAQPFINNLHEGVDWDVD